MMLKRLIQKQSPTERPRADAHRPLRRVLAAALCACLMLTMLPANALAAGTQEQFNGLTVGETYYFDLSGQNIPGTKNSALPGTTLHYVPFIYAGTVNAYSLAMAGVATENGVSVSNRSLFIADYNVTHTVSWDKLNSANLIFGKNYTSGGVTYKLCAPSVGSSYTGSGDGERGIPGTNEWDQILNKGDYIKNWSGARSWGQETYVGNSSDRTERGNNSARYVFWHSSDTRNVNLGFRPVLEVLNAGTLGSGGLCGVTLNANGGTFTNWNEQSIKIVLKGSNGNYTAPAKSYISKTPAVPDGADSISFKEWNTAANGTGTGYAAGASVPASVTTLYAIYKPYTAPTKDPSFSQSTVKFAGSEDKTVTLTDSNGADGRTYKVYAAATGGEALSSPTVSVDQSDKTKLTLTFTEQPSQLTQYFISAKVDGRDESERRMIAIQPYGKLIVALAQDTVTATFSESLKKFISLISLTLDPGDEQGVTFEQTDFMFSTSSTEKAQVENWSITGFTYKGDVQKSGTINFEIGRDFNAERLYLWYKDSCLGEIVYIKQLSHKVTVDSNIQNGTVTAKPTAGIEDKDVALTVTPSDGYTLDTISVYKTSDKETTVPVNENEGAYFFTMPTYAVTVTATFKGSDAPALYPEQVAFETADASAVSFTLSSAPESTSYKVYAAAEGGEALTDPAVSVENNVLTLTFTSKPTEAKAYYISATTGSLVESTRTEVTVSPYVAPTYGVTLDPATDKTFTAATVGYGEQTAHNVTVQNSGNQPTGALTVALSGTNSGSFTLSATSIDSIAAEGSASFTVKPNTGLTAGTYTATVTVSGDNNISASFGVSFTVSSGTTPPPSTTAPTITTTSLSGGTVGTAYSATLAASGTTPITWSVNEGSSLPNGLTLNTSTGVISGTPTTTGTSTFTVKATNSAGNATKELSITISAAPQPTTYAVTIANTTNGTVTASATSAAANTEITLTVTPSQGYELDALSVYKTGETGTTVNVSNNKFTMPAYGVTVSATFKTATTPSTNHSITYSLTNLTATGQPETVSNNAALSATLTAASGYKLPDTITVTMGGTTLTVGEGYTYNSTTGEVGISSVTGNVVITAAGVAKSTNATLSALSYTVGSGQATPVPNFSASTETYNVELPSTTGATAAITLTGTPATGASITTNAGVTLSGGTGTATVTVTAEDGTTTKTYTVNFTTATTPPPSGTAPTITTASLSDGTVGTAYSQTLTASGTTPITWSVSAGSLPNGLTLSGATISGTPTTTGTSTFTVKASNGTSPDDTKQLSIKIEAAVQPGTKPEITTTTLTGGAVGEQYTAALAATGDTPITWTISAGTLPNGLTLNGATISGTPTAAGTFSFTAKAVNTTGEDTQELSITIAAPEATVTSVTVTPATATVKKGTTQQFSAAVTGTNDPAQTVTWALEGDHASGTSISEGGLLTVAGDETAATLTVKATSTADDSKSATATVTVTTEDVTKYGLTVTDGSGSGEYEAGAQITVTAETKANKRFKDWTATGITLTDATENPVTITMPAGAVTLAANYDDVYAVTATSDSNGTATASPATAAQGDTVNITATANSGYQFKEWQVISGGVSLADATASSTSFTMPGQAVEVKAIFEETTTPPTTTYTITFNANGGNALTPGTAQTGTDGKLQSLPTPTRSGSYRFDGWYTATSGGTVVTVNTVFSANDTIYAHWTYTGSTGGGGNNNSSNTTTETTHNPDGSTTTTTTDKKTGTVTETTKAPDGTKTVVETKKDGTVTETVNKPDGTEAETVKTPEGKITETLKRPDGVKTETVTEKNGETTAKVSVPSSKDSATVTLPVKDAAPGTVAIIVHADGTEEIVKKSISGEDGLTLTLEDSAELKIVDNSKQFKDVPEKAWYAEAAEFASSRELFQGTAPDTFSPGANLNRGMFVTVLYRLENEPDATGADFSDVKDGAYYEKAVAWAAQNEIVAGIGNGQYAPNRSITRQELAAMFYRYADHLGLDLSAGSADLNSFKDGGEVSGFAQDPMKWCVANGIISGKGNGVLDPGGNATRAEAVSMLMRFVNLLVK